MCFFKEIQHIWANSFSNLEFVVLNVTILLIFIRMMKTYTVRVKSKGCKQ